MSQAFSIAATATRQELPRVSEIKRYKVDPRNGGLCVHHQIIMSEDDWRSCPESAEGGWDTTHFGPLVVASKFTFLMGMKMAGGEGG